MGGDDGCKNTRGKNMQMEERWEVCLDGREIPWVARRWTKLHRRDPCEVDPGASLVLEVCAEKKSGKEKTSLSDEGENGRRVTMAMETGVVVVVWECREQQGVMMFGKEV